jgi:hypothetical protein
MSIVMAVPQSITTAAASAGFTRPAAAAAANRSIPTRPGSESVTASGKSVCRIRRCRIGRCRVAEISATAASSRVAAAS